MRNTSSTGLATLASGLARRLAEESADSNLVFSPLSIYAALSLVAAGARAATLDEILRVLGARSRLDLEKLVSLTAADTLKDRSESGGPSVAFACGVWSDLTRPLKRAFRQAVVGTYKAEASVVDFRRAPEEARNQINAWVAQATRNLIDSVLPPGSIDPATTRVVLGNAVYFKGTWEDQPFDRTNTVRKPFHRLDGSLVDVPFMQSWEQQFVAVHRGFKVLKLRYKMAARDHERTTSLTPAAPPVDFDTHTYDRVPPQSGEYGAHIVRPDIDFLHAGAARAIAGHNRGGFAARPSHHTGFFVPPSPSPPPFTLYSHASPEAYPIPYPQFASSHGDHVFPPYPRFFVPPPLPPFIHYSPYPEFASHGAFHDAGPYGYTMPNASYAPHPGYPMPNAYGPRPHAAAPVNHTNASVPHSYAPEPWTSGRYSDPTQFSMCIFLPDAHDGLQGLLDKIASSPGFLHDHLPERRVHVREFRLPRFKLSFQGSVVAILKKLGLERPFSNQADLSDMVEDDGSGLSILVDDVIHKAVIEVNEEGTEAAAVTMGSFAGGFSMHPQPPPPRLDFVADHPFAFYIVEEATGAVVFAGHVLDPSKKA